MKRFICMAIIVIASLTVLGNVEGFSKVRPRGRAKASGGIVEKAYRGNVLRIINTQTAANQDVVAGIVTRMRYSSQLPIEVSPKAIPSEQTPIEFASSARTEKDVGAAVIIVDNPKLPIILSSPDGRWAILNVAPLKNDNTKFSERLNKALWGAVARSVGAGSTGDRGCVFAPYANVSELDAIAASEPSPIAHNALLDVAKASGINTLFFATYRTACQQGWAPAPTNDVQQAIWDETRKLPTKPIQIKFDPKKGR